MANKYVITNIGKAGIVTESDRYDVTVDVDSLGVATVNFGSSFSLKIGYNDIEILENMLNAARRHLEDQAIDQAGTVARNQPLPFIYKSPDKPENW